VFLFNTRQYKGVDGVAEDQLLCYATTHSQGIQIFNSQPILYKIIIALIKINPFSTSTLFMLVNPSLLVTISCLWNTSLFILINPLNKMNPFWLNATMFRSTATTSHSTGTTSCKTATMGSSKWSTPSLRTPQ
jgi:hypothetical protein